MSYTGRMKHFYSIARFVVFEGRTPLISYDIGSKLRGTFQPVKRTYGDASDSTPRDRPTHVLRIAKNTLNKLTIVPTPGSRITVDEVDYECVSDARPLTTNNRTYGYEIELLPISKLYPYEGVLSGTDNEQLEGVAPIEFILWEGSETTERRGRYDDLRGEAPIDRWADLKEPNRIITMQGERYVITSALVAIEQPHIDLRLRRRDA